MKFSYREDKREDRLLDILTDEANGLRIAVSRLGAELISVARRDPSGEWIGFLYRDNDVTAPPRGWTNHATVMGYYLHRLKNGRSLYRGHEIRGGNHSFLRSLIWHPISQENLENGRLTYQVTPNDFSPADYPLNVSLELTYRLEPGAVTPIFRFVNHEKELTAHVGFGLHPGFAAASFNSFEFQMPAGKYRRWFAPENFLSGETQEIDFPGGAMPFPREQLPGSFIIELVEVPKRDFVFTDSPSGRQVTIDLTGVPYLTLWSDGGPFLCIEPCWGLTDRHDQKAFEDKDGIQTIPARGQLSAQCSIRPELIDQAIAAVH
jgi:galactose mutarotase-like enzyme